MSLALFLIGLAVGALAAWLGLRRALATTRADRDTKAQQLAAASAALEVERRSLDERMRHVIKALSADALKESNDAFLSLADTKLAGYVAPLKESLEKVDGQVRTLEQARQAAFGALRQEILSLRDGQDRLRTETGNLVTALRAPHVRGRWGEIQLKRVVELAGMVAYCDFVEQVHTTDADGRALRPDLVVKLPGGKHVVVDAKVPLSAYLDGIEASDGEVRRLKLAEHARQVRDHVQKLGSKGYWRQFEPAPDFVVMFMPDESFFRAALEHDPSLIEFGVDSGVIAASPTTLIGLLRTISYGWQQETVAQSARAVGELGRELYERLGTLAKHFAKLGRTLDGAVGAYNEAVGSLESRVLVTARRFEHHGITAEVPEIAPLERTARPLQAPELTGPQPVELPPADAA